MMQLKSRDYFTIAAKVIVVLSFFMFIYLQYLKFYYSPDDTYIYLKYSKNLASGYNFSFNIGEPSYGVTSPLWTGILAVPFLIGVSGFWFAKTLDIILIMFSFVLFFRLTEYFFKENRLLSYFGLILFMINPWVIRSSFTGMETSLAVCIVLMIFHAYYKEKYSLLFILIGISVLVRPEFLVLFFVFLGVIIFRNTGTAKANIKNIIKYILLTSLIVVPFLIFAYINFGTIISNTSTGKVGLSGDMQVLLGQAKEIFRIFIMVGPLETLLAFGGALFIIVNRNNSYLPMVLYIAGLLLLYMVTSAAVMARYFLILFPVVVLLALHLIEKIKYRPGVIIPVFLIIFIVYSQVVFFSYIKPYCDGFTEGIYSCLIPIGEWLNNNTPPGSRVLVNDVGAIGFTTNRYIIDAAALINRDLNLNKKIKSVPNVEKEYPHLMLNFIDADYLIEKDTARIKPMEEAYNFKLEACESFVFRQMWVLDPAPKYFTIYRIKNKN